METAEGIQGWVGNRDLLAMQLARGRKFGLPEQSVKGSDLNISPLIFKMPSTYVEPLPLDRSFAGEIIEAMDKEQVEIRNGEN